MPGTNFDSPVRLLQNFFFNFPCCERSRPRKATLSLRASVTSNDQVFVLITPLGLSVVGQTGVGKSSVCAPPLIMSFLRSLKGPQFIQIATGHNKIVGHGLLPHTKHVTPIRAPFANHIVLVDTPGVDGVSISDLDALKMIYEWLQRT